MYSVLTHDKKKKQKAVETGYNSLYSNSRALSCRKCPRKAKPIDHHCRDTASGGLDKQPKLLQPQTPEVA